MQLRYRTGLHRDRDGTRYLAAIRYRLADGDLSDARYLAASRYLFGFGYLLTVIHQAFVGGSG